MPADAVKTLRDVLPYQALSSEYDWTEKKLSAEVVATYEGWQVRWPGKHKNVVCWWVLADGTAVGWNENVSVGGAFPVMRYNGGA